MRYKLLLLLMMGVFFSATLISAALVGVGITPSKVEKEIVGGVTTEIEFLVFNTGDEPLDVQLFVEGEIAAFSKIEPERALIQPEEMPHVFPIKYGKVFRMKVTPPADDGVEVYEGMVSALSSSKLGVSFGGSVGSASRVELKVVPPFYRRSILGVASVESVILGLAFIPLILSAVLSLRMLRKKGKAKKK